MVIMAIFHRHYQRVKEKGISVGSEPTLGNLMSEVAWVSSHLKIHIHIYVYIYIYDALELSIISNFL